jgi:hypothetical protein
MIDWEARKEWCLKYALRGVKELGTAEEEAKQLAENVPNFPGWEEVDEQNDLG